MSANAMSATNVMGTTNEQTTIITKKKGHKSEQIDLLLEQNKALQLQLQFQQQQIDQLLHLNSQILVNTDKMGKHIDFINRSYDKITQSYFFKNLLS